MATCTGCGCPGVPYEHRGITFDGLCAFRGERLCPACRDACLEDGGVNILVASYQPQIPPHVINTARDRDVTFTGFVFPEQRGGYNRRSRSTTFPPQTPKEAPDGHPAER